MIANLFTQEYVDSRRGLAALFGVYALAQAVLWGIIAMGVPFLSTLFVWLSALLIALLVPGTLALLAWNYWQSMYGRRGYFTFSIPVSGRALYAVKVTYAALAASLALVLAGLSVPALIAVGAVGARTSVGDVFFLIGQAIPAQLPGWVIPVVILLVFVQTYVLVIVGAAIMSIGAQGRYNSMGFGAPLIGAVIFYVANQAIGLIAAMVIPLGIGLTGPTAGKLVFRSMGPELVAAIQTGAEPTVVGLGSYVAALVVTAAMAWWAVNAIEKHTSLR